ncbi:hypothetical protein BEL04_23355 [Mucilaginibacter sp. PPCGB 2223]|uniref:FAD/NAD(P)-binding protein n=1 Tax=Mucilaginibacter sp. PPCGB 2223 TaxID=1886027 RepID=UPI000825F507|nr:FAD/NAD(P)-binding protein [Mucilaginibacter sp. PPCGB 2223]OCX50250.1 hypothetical protein BEL04_23355 [Mucilaginibacter sp. PPCGB 2223]
MSGQSQPADITFIGSGIACTATLIQLFRKLLNTEQAGNTRPEITVIEKNREFWKGIPYGSRSSVNALTITCVNDFIYEAERPAFFRWFKENQNDWETYYREHGGITAERWLKNNLPLIAKNDWETVYIPRFIFGWYIHNTIAKLHRQIEEKQLAKINLIHAEAIDARVTGNKHYEVKLEHPDKSISYIISRKLVIATGSAVVKPVDEVNAAQVTYINDIYEPSVPLNIEKVKDALTQTDWVENRNVLIIGSNASSIELLYLLEGLPQVNGLINNLVLISPSGALPYHISTETLDEHPTPSLKALQNKGSYNLKTLVDAAAADLQPAIKNGANVAYIATVIGNTLKLMEALGDDAKKEFFGIHGMRLSNMFRRSGPEYKAGSQQLADVRKVSFIKGKFIQMQTRNEGVVLRYEEVSSGTEKTYPLTFKAVINCSGSDNLDRSASPLIYNLVHKKLAAMNLSGKGFEVNEHFEAAPNLYIMGPLLGGNMNKLIHFWHLENASRLMYLAPYLANELLKD